MCDVDAQLLANRTSRIPIVDGVIGAKRELKLIFIDSIDEGSFDLLFIL